jgi:hypothetical protein
VMAGSKNFADELGALKRLLFNERLENSLHVQDFQEPEGIFAYLQALIAVVSRTDSPSPQDPHFRQWRRMKQYIFGASGSKESSRGLIEHLFDLLDSLLPQEKAIRGNGNIPNISWNLDGDRLDMVVNHELHQADGRTVFSLTMKGLSSCPTENSRGKFSPVRAVSEALQYQVEILHLIACTLRILWKIVDWNDPSADRALEFWHPQLGYLPRVLQKFYGTARNDSLNSRSRQAIWDDRIQRLRMTEVVSNDALVDCLADQVCRIFSLVLSPCLNM